MSADDHTLHPSSPHTIVYPESDGEPLGETGVHALVISELLIALQLRYQGQDVHVCTNQFHYYEEGNPHAVVCPDLYVVFGTEDRPRNSWKVWVEGVFAQVVFEITSVSSRFRDRDPKHAIYERAGAREYVVFDPLPVAPDPRLLLFRRDDDGRLALAGSGPSVRSETLGLDLMVEPFKAGNFRLRAVDVATGERLLFPAETAALLERTGREKEALRREKEALSRESDRLNLAAQAEIERLRRENARLRGDDPPEPPPEGR